MQYSKDRVADVYPAYQLGWFPDYSDADNYLTPFFLDGQLPGEPLRQPGGQRPDPRSRPRRPTPPRAPGDDRGHPGARSAADLSTVPLLQGAQVAVTGTDVTGADTLDASFKFRYGALAKG